MLEGKGPTDPVLAAVALCRTYEGPDETLQVLRGVDLAVYWGEIVAVIGASGVGKSTLLHLLGGLDRPSSGQVLVGGRDLSTMTERELALTRNTRIGFVFQFHHLLREFTALENVMMPLLLAGVSAREATERAMTLLADFGLEPRAKHRPSELSGGEAQRVAVARALVGDPLVVLADEPSGNLDPKHSEELHELIWRMRDDRGRSFIIATHDRELARRADRVVEIRAGLAWPLQSLDDDGTRRPDRRPHERGSL